LSISNLTVGGDQEKNMDNTSAGEILDDVHTGGHPAGHTVAGE